MKGNIRTLLETICEMAAYTECDFIFIEAIANKYGLTINEDLCLEEVNQYSKEMRN